MLDRNREKALASKPATGGSVVDVVMILLRCAFLLGFCGILIRSVGAHDMPLYPPQSGYTVVDAFAGVKFDQPVALRSPPGETNRLFVVERTGKIMLMTNLAAPTASVFLDLRTDLDASPWEAGLLGLTFHPGYATNGRFFVYRTLTTSSPA